MNHDHQLPQLSASDAAPPQRPRMSHPLPDLRDWALFAIGVMFVSVAIFILIKGRGSDRDTGIIGLAFFGSCLFVFTKNIVRKFRYRGLEGIDVRIVGGVPVRPSKWRVVMLGGWLLTLGVILLGFATSAPLTIKLMSAFIAAVGLSLLVATLLGLIPHGYLQFDPEGFTIANRRWTVQIPWDQIAGLGVGETSNNPTLFLAVHDPGALRIEPAGAQSKAVRAIARTRSMVGWDFYMLSDQYGVDAPVLSAAIAHYAADVAERGSLGQRALPAANHT